MAMPKKLAFLLINFKHIWVDERRGTLVARRVWAGTQGSESFSLHPPSREVCTYVWAPEAAASHCIYN